MSKTATLIATVIVALVACPVPSSGEIGLRPVEKIYDFGGVGIDFEVFHSYKLVNTGKQPVRVDSVIAKCDCSRIWVVDSIIAPGDTGAIGLSFSTADYYGRVSKLMKVYTNSTAMPYVDFFYLSTVGQWFFGLAPKPVSLFFLPGHKSKKVFIPNKALDQVEITELDPYDDLASVKIIQKKARKGEGLELEIAPKADLGSGTYRTNFRLTIELSGDHDPLFLTIPVKIVRY